jgi:rhodanese-related sulfurtransferase
MATRIDAVTVKGWLREPGEIAFLDVREAGQFGEGHPFFAIPVPYSVFESRLPALVPNLNVRLVLIDGGDGVSERAARRAEGLGYHRVHIVDGGVEAWQAAGFTLFAGVNLPSKTFGEIVELQRHTPRVTPEELMRLKADGSRIVIVDGRPFSEFQKMNIPGGICCPNGELALRISEIAADPEVQIVVNCAGRTRSIIGAETLRALGLPNKIVALENGTQGWFLAGFELERGASRRHTLAVPDPQIRGARAKRARDLARQCGAGFATADVVSGWLGEPDRTTFVIDVRSLEEHAADSVPGAAKAPGGQLIQATDQWVGVKGARLVLFDDDGVRAPMVGHWLAQLGHETWVLEDGAEAAHGLPLAGRVLKVAAPIRTVAMAEVGPAMAAGACVIDLRASAAFRAGHIGGAEWSIRPRILTSGAAKGGGPVILAGPREEIGLAAIDLREAGVNDFRWLEGGPQQWEAGGLSVVADRDNPLDIARIDFLFFVHDRHEGNAEAARRYLAWETGLLAQLDPQERGVFRVADLPR